MTDSIQPTETQSTRSQREVITFLIAFKVAYFLLILVAIFVIPIQYNEHLFFNNYHTYSKLPAIPLRNFVTWDAEHYIGISYEGYSGAPENAAFYPLWPAFLFVFRHIFGGAAAAGVILANVFSIAGLALFYKLIQSKFDKDIADKSILLLLCLPGAIFLTFPYTEALFLLLCVATLNCMEKNRCWRAGLWAFLAALTRPVGVFLMLVFIAAAIKCKDWKVALAGLCPILGIGLVMLVLREQTGSALGQIHAISQYSNGTSPMNFLHPVAFFASLTNVDPTHSYGHSPIDRLFFLWLLGSLPWTWKRDKTWFAYSVATGVLPAIATMFISYSRYVLMAFPMVVSAATYFNEPKRQPYFVVVLAALFMLQVYFLILHINYYWAG